jgi:hypothetical protein
MVGVQRLDDVALEDWKEQHCQLSQDLTTTSAKKKDFTDKATRKKRVKDK